MRGFAAGGIGEGECAASPVWHGVVIPVRNHPGRGKLYPFLPARQVGCENKRVTMACSLGGRWECGGAWG